jgi:hypothetical protein
MLNFDFTPRTVFLMGEYRRVRRYLDETRGVLEQLGVPLTSLRFIRHAGRLTVKTSEGVVRFCYIFSWYDMRGYKGPFELLDFGFAGDIGIHESYRIQRIYQEFHHLQATENARVKRPIEADRD